MLELRSGIAACSALLLVGCATSGLNEFPTRDQLTELHAKPLPASALTPTGISVDHWELAGPLPQRFGDAPYVEATPWGQALSALAASKGAEVQVTEDMHCVAREFGRFVLANGALPSEELHQFITGRCGAVATQFELRWTTGTTTPTEGAPEVYARWKGQKTDPFADAVGSGNRAVGIWFGRKDTRFVALVASGIRRARLEPTERTPDSLQHIVLRGEVLVPASHLDAMVNQGEFGSGDCLPDLTVGLPRFAITCSVLPSDSEARLQMAAFPPGRVFGPIALDLTVWPQGRGGLTFIRTEAPAAASPADLSAALLEKVNAVRAQARLGALQLAAKESETSNQVAPYYFAAATGKTEPLVADVVALGLRAGWDVEGEIQNAEFTSAVLEDSRDPARLVASALASPFGRAVLLGRDSRLLAVGQAEFGTTGLGAVFTSYSLFDGQSAEVAAREVVARITALRAARGLPAPVPLQGLEAAVASADASLRSGAATPENALQSIMESARDHGQALSGVWTLTPTLAFTLPDSVLRPGPLQLSVTVSIQKTDDYPWARYVVLLAFPQQDAVAMADLEAMR